MSRKPHKVPAADIWHTSLDMLRTTFDAAITTPVFEAVPMVLANFRYPPLDPDIWRSARINFWIKTLVCENHSLPDSKRS